MNVNIRRLTVTLLLPLTVAAFGDQTQSKLAGSWTLVEGVKEFAGEQQPLTTHRRVYLVVNPDGTFYQAGNFWTHSAYDSLRKKGDRLEATNGDSLTVTQSLYQPERSEIVLAHSGGYQMSFEAKLLENGLVSYRSTKPSYGGADLITIATLRRLNERPWEKPDALLAEWKVSSTPLAVDLSHDGNLVVATDLTRRSVFLWNVRQGRQVQVFAGHANDVCSVAISPDGEYIASGSRSNGDCNDKSLRIWDVATGKQIKHIDTFSTVQSLQFLADGKSVLAGGAPSPQGGGASAGIWNIETGKPDCTFLNAGVLRNAIISPDGQHVVCVRSPRNGLAVGVFDVASGNEIRSIGNPRQPIDAISLSPDGRRLVITMQDPFVYEWSLETGTEIRRFRVDETWASQVAYLRDGKRIIIANTSDDSLRLWDIQSGKELHNLGGHRDHIHSLRISADGRIAVSASGDGTVRVWKLPSA